MPQKQGIQLNKYTPDYVVFDLETTGISRTFDEVVEISAVKVRSGQVVDEFSTLVNPGRHIPAGASQVNGITDQMVADCPLFSQVLQEFLNFTEGLTLVGHNIASFDMKFIWRDAEKYYGELVPNDYVDTLKVAKDGICQNFPDIGWWIWQSIMAYRRREHTGHSMTAA